MVAAAVTGRTGGRSGANRPKWPLLLLLIAVASPASGSNKAFERELQNIIGRADCPEYFVLGHQKCGSKMLHKQITENLEFAREVQDSSQSSYNLFARFKAPLFQSNAKVLLIDVSPDYFRNLDVPLRIRSFCNYSGEKKSPPKFVVSLCDPANRTWAAFRDSHSSSDRINGSEKLQAKAAGYAFQKFTDASTTNSDKFIQDSYERCIKTTLPMVDKCLESMAYPQCFRALLGTTGPSTDHLIPDALGIPFPCKGVIFNSLYEQQLAYWKSVFPKEDFLVLYMDDWLEDQKGALEAVSRHFPAASLKSSFERDFTPLEAPSRSLTPPPEEQQEWLRVFFSEHRGWVDQVEFLGGHESSHS